MAVESSRRGPDVERSGKTQSQRCVASALTCLDQEMSGERSGNAFSRTYNLKFGAGQGPTTTTYKAGDTQWCPMTRGQILQAQLQAVQDVM